jgi:hypothetical protein
MRTDPLSGIDFFRCAACLVVLACESDEELLYDAIVTTLDVIETDDCGVGVNGNGFAEFCLILTISMVTQAQEMFGKMLERRLKFVEQAPAVGTPKLSFCIALIRGALYVPVLRKLIEPEVFGTPMMRHEWQAAIDYFIARGNDLKLEEN